MATVLEKEAGLAPEVVAGVATNETAAEDEKQRVNPVPERKRKKTKSTIRDMQKPEPLGQTAIEDPYSDVEGWIQGQPEVTQKNQSPTGEKSIEDQRKENEAYWKQREAEEAERTRQQSRRLEQDRDQWQQTQQRKDTRRYKEDTKQYDKDMKVYEHDVKEYEKAKAEYDKDVAKYHSDLDKWMKDNKSEIYDAWSKKENKYEKAQEHIDTTVKQWEAQVKDAEKKDARWYQIKGWNESDAYQKYRDAIDRYRDWQKRGLAKNVDKKYKEQYGNSYLGYWRDATKEQYNRKWGSKIAHNDALNKKYGSRPQVSIPSLGILSRTAADIIQGKSNVPLKQVSSHVYRQVAYYRLGQRYKNTNMTYNEFQQAKAQIYNTIYEKQSAEQARRNWSAAISAKSAAAKASEKHNLMLKEMNKQNRLNQMAAQTLQNKIVNTQLKKANIDASNLKIAQGKPQPATMVSMTRPSPVQQSPTDKPTPAQSIFDIPQSEFAAMQAARGLTEEFKIGQWKSSEQGDFIKRKTLPTVTYKPAGVGSKEQSVKVPKTSAFLIQGLIAQRALLDSPWEVRIGDEVKKFSNRADANAFIKEWDAKQKLAAKQASQVGSEWPTLEGGYQGAAAPQWYIGWTPQTGAQFTDKFKTEEKTTEEEKPYSMFGKQFEDAAWGLEEFHKKIGQDKTGISQQIFGAGTELIKQTAVDAVHIDNLLEQSKGYIKSGFTKWESEHKLLVPPKALLDVNIDAILEGKTAPEIAQRNIQYGKKYGAESFTGAIVPLAFLAKDVVKGGIEVGKRVVPKTVLEVSERSVGKGAVEAGKTINILTKYELGIGKFKVPITGKYGEGGKRFWGTQYKPELVPLDKMAGRFPSPSSFDVYDLSGYKMNELKELRKVSEAWEKQGKPHFKTSTIDDAIERKKFFEKAFKELDFQPSKIATPEKWDRSPPSEVVAPKKTAPQKGVSYIALPTNVAENLVVNRLIPRGTTTSLAKLKKGDTILKIVKDKENIAIRQLTPDDWEWKKIIKVREDVAKGELIKTAKQVQLKEFKLAKAKGEIPKKSEFVFKQPKIKKTESGFTTDLKVSSVGKPDKKLSVDVDWISYDRSAKQKLTTEFDFPLEFKTVKDSNISVKKPFEVKGLWEARMPKKAKTKPNPKMKFGEDFTVDFNPNVTPYKSRPFTSDWSIGDDMIRKYQYQDPKSTKLNITTDFESGIKKGRKKRINITTDFDKFKTVKKYDDFKFTKDFSVITSGGVDVKSPFKMTSTWESSLKQSKVKPQQKQFKITKSFDKTSVGDKPVPNIARIGTITEPMSGGKLGVGNLVDKADRIKLTPVAKTISKGQKQEVAENIVGSYIQTQTKYVKPKPTRKEKLKSIITGKKLKEPKAVEIKNPRTDIMGDIDIGTKTEVKGDILEGMLIRTDVGKGYGGWPTRKGVYFGKVDPEKPFWTAKFNPPKTDLDKGKFVRGDNLGRIKNLEDNTASFLDAPRAKLWVTNNPKYTKRYTKPDKEIKSGDFKIPAKADIDVDMSQVYRFDDLPKETQERLMDYRFEDFKSFKEDPIGYEGGYRSFQEALEIEARKAGKGAYAKPLPKDPKRVLDPKTWEYEVAIFDPNIVKSVKNIPPTGYKPLAGQPVNLEVNITRPRDEIQNLIGDPDKMFGKDIQGKTWEQTIKGTSKSVKKEPTKKQLAKGQTKPRKFTRKGDILKMDDFEKQTWKKFKSNLGIADKEGSLKGTQYDTPEIIEKMFDKYTVRAGISVPHRIEKDMSDLFLAMRDIHEGAWVTKKKKLATEAGNLMNKMVKQESWFDWRKGIQSRINEPSTMRIEKFRKLGESEQEKIFKDLGSAKYTSPIAGGKTTSSAGKSKPSGFEEEYKKDYTSSKQSSVKPSASISSPKKKIFTSSSIKSSVIKSPRSISVKSPRSISVKSPRSPLSPKSPKSTLSPKSPKSTLSPKPIPSPSSPKPSPTRSPKSPLSPKSPKSPKPKSVKSKSIRSVPVSARISPQEKTKRPIILPQLKSTTDKKKGKKYETHDFLGSMPLRSFEGMFKRSSVIHGDKRTDKMVLKDRKRKFKELKTRLF